MKNMCIKQHCKKAGYRLEGGGIERGILKTYLLNFFSATIKYMHFIVFYITYVHSIKSNVY